MGTGLGVPMAAGAGMGREGHRPVRRLWSRRNPFRRRTDVLEGWAAVGAFAVFVLGGTAAGWAAASAVHEELSGRSAERVRTTAVLLQDTSAPTMLRGDAWSGGKVLAKVGWRDADGLWQTGRARVTGGLGEGAKAEIWTDTTGRHAVDPPPPPVDTGVQSAVAAGAAAGAVGCLAFGCRTVLRVRLDRRRADEWELDWARVEPHWRQGSAGPSER
ncbi:Rv1733c family protein [Streptomyces synnematoformans]